MRLPTSSRGTALVAGAALTTAATATAMIITAGGPSAASAAPRPTPISDPTVTPLAAALLPAPIDIDRKAPSNVVTVRLDFAPGDTTGWHSHPGPVLVQVVSGTLTLRHASHGRCLTDTVGAGHGFFEKAGAVHVAANHRLHPAVVYATFVLPQGAPPEVPASIPAVCR